jgi:ribosome-binding factor A
MSRFASDKGPTQRQLRAGELIRHAVAGILQREELRDPGLSGVIVTVTEVRMSPDLKHANVYVAPLGHTDPAPMVKGLNRAASFLRAKLGREIDMKFTPDLRFHADDRYDAAEKVDEILARPEVARDLDHDLDHDEGDAD